MKPQRRNDDRSAADELLDELLALDPEPRLSSEAAERIRSGLVVADDVALDALLGLDDIEVPGDLAERVLARSRDEIAATKRRRFRPRARAAAMTAVPLAAAAALLLWVATRPEPARSVEPARDTPRVAAAGPGAGPGAGDQATADLLADEPTDELLAALPVLEEMGFLTEDLDPLELEALFLFDADEDVLLDLALDAGLLEENG